MMQHIRKIGQIKSPKQEMKWKQSNTESVFKITSLEDDEKGDYSFSRFGHFGLC